MGYVYILRSLKNKKYYIGSTINLNRRLTEHNNGKVRYTSLSRPFELVFSQEYKTDSEARQIEYKLKKLKSKVIIERIISDGKIRLLGS